MTYPTNFDQLWIYNQPAESESRFRYLLVEAEQAGPAYQAELLTQIARAQGLQRQFDAAHATLDQAATLITEAMPRAQVRLLLERGRVFRSAGDAAAARPLFLQALALAQAPGEDFYAIDAAHMLGIIDPPDEALAWNQQALAMAERSADPRAQGWRGSLYNNIGWTLHDKGEYEPALDMFQQALAFRETQSDAEATRVARWSVARALRSLGRVEEALAIQRDLERDGPQDGYVYEELGECSLALGRSVEAQPHFARAYALLSQDAWLAESEPARLMRLKDLGQSPHATN